MIVFYSGVAFVGYCNAVSCWCRSRVSQALDAKEALLQKMSDLEHDTTAYKSDASTKIADLQARLEEATASNVDVVKSMKAQVR